MGSGHSAQVQAVATAKPVDAEYSVLVAGSTGACGKALVSQHLQDPNCTRVIALTRRPIDDIRTVFAEGDLDKLTVKQVDYDNLQSADISKEKATVAVCALGSAPYSEESDYVVPCKFATYCKELGIKSMILVSAAGSSKGSILGYVDTLGRREEFFRNAQFDKCIILRPKLLLRHELARTKEVVFDYLTPSSQKIDVADVARAAVTALSRDWPGNILSLEHADLLDISKV